MAREKVKWCENCAMLEKMYLDSKAMHDTQVGDVRALREENAQLKAKLARVVEAALDLVGEYESHGGEDTHRECLEGCGCVLPQKVAGLRAAAKGE